MAWRLQHDAFSHLPFFTYWAILQRYIMRPSAEVAAGMESSHGQNARHGAYIAVHVRWLLETTSVRSHGRRNYQLEV